MMLKLIFSPNYLTKKENPEMTTPPWYTETFMSRMANLFIMDTLLGNHPPLEVYGTLQKATSKGLAVTFGGYNKIMIPAGSHKVTFKTPLLEYHLPTSADHLVVTVRHDLLDVDDEHLLNELIYEYGNPDEYIDNMYTGAIRMAAIDFEITPERAAYLAFIHDEAIVTGIYEAISDEEIMTIEVPNEGEYRIVKVEDILTEDETYQVHFYPSDEFKKLAGL
jgi:hypothetical protein